VFRGHNTNLNQEKETNKEKWQHGEKAAQEINQTLVKCQLEHSCAFDVSSI